MKSESIGANPGAMWRFMDITNKNYKTVFVLDIDDLKWSSRIRLLEQFKDYKLCSTHSGDVTITNEPYCPAYNFCTINASGIISKPQKFDYNIVDVMKGFINLCKNREKSANPYCFDDNDPITYWNQPVQGHKYGWGRIPTKYAFDEFFLKHVVYYDAYPDFKQV
jgi:hypothetical protein